MPHSLRLALAIGLLGTSVLGVPAQTKKSDPPAVPVTIETTLATDAGHIRQFAFDGDAQTYFASRGRAGSSDHFTLTFDKPVSVKSIAVTTGKPEGGDALDEGTLEVLGDNKKWEELAMFAEGVAGGKPNGRKLRAVRIRPGSDLDHPLAIREFAIESDPPLAVFRSPVEFVVNVDDAPEMKKWADRVARICERAYPMINDELKSDGFKPATVVTLTLKSDYNGVAATSGSRIVGSVKFFTAHPEDVGAMVHETVHVCQRYRGKFPGWLVEGIADYIRFYKFEPGKLRPLSPNRARYDGSYQITARFLAYVTQKYDKEFVRKLNRYLREGEYTEEVFKLLTKKSVQQLNEEWRASLLR
jgi:hypothetical protein